MPVRHVCLSAAGVYGFYQLGCMDAARGRLEMADDLTVVGTSAGAIVGLAVALGLSGRDLLAAALREDLSNLATFSLRSLLEGMGMDDGSKLFGAVRKAFSTCAGEDVAAVTLGELKERRGVTLKIVATCLETASPEVFGPDTHPGLGALDAIRMSAAVPFMFTPVKHDGRTYVDGALTAYYPSFVCPKDPASSIGVCMKKDKAAGSGRWTLASFAGAVYDSTIRAERGLRWTLYTPVGKANTAFGITGEEAREMYESGLADMNRFLDFRKDD